jgi:hypothetical protein
MMICKKNFERNDRGLIEELAWNLSGGNDENHEDIPCPDWIRNEHLQKASLERYH